VETYDYTSEYDNKPDNSQFIKFYPFIGKKYKTISHKIMVLGESHYIDPNIPDEQLTEKQLADWDNDKYNSRYVFVDDYFPEIRSNGTHPYHWIRCYRNTAAMITGIIYLFTIFFKKVLEKVQKAKNI
jgi:hypothetical protein